MAGTQKKKFRMALVPPFKGRPADELRQFVLSCSLDTGSEKQRIRDTQLLLNWILDMDPDCLRQAIVEKPTENPTGLQPEAMVEKMDVLFQTLFEGPLASSRESTYHAILDIFEHSILRLIQPNYIQYIVYRMACASRERCDNFLSLLLNVLHDSSADPIVRREAVSYVVSFVVRCPHLNWLHSARTGKYLVSFMHSLDVSGSAPDRLLFGLCLQSLIYLFCWESDRWRFFTEDKELSWISGSLTSLYALLEKYEGVLALVNKDILSRAGNIMKRVSVEIGEMCVSALENYSRLRSNLPLIWRPLVGSELMEPYYPFESEPLRNLHRSGPFLSSIIREWSDPPVCPDARRKAIKSFAGADEGWNFHPLTATYSPLFNPANMASPMMTAGVPEMEMTGFDLGPNLVLNRIISSEKFARPM